MYHISMKCCFTDMAWMSWLLFIYPRSFSCVRLSFPVSNYISAAEDLDHKLYINSTCTAATLGVNLYKCQESKEDMTASHFSNIKTQAWKASKANIGSRTDYQGH